MTFTYDLSSVDATLLAISKVRLEIGDIVSGAGVRPDGTNFTDEELSVWLDDEDSNVKLTAARACEALARAWNLVAKSETVGPRKIEYGDISANFEKLASSLISSSGADSARPVVYII